MTAPRRRRSPSSPVPAAASARGIALALAADGFDVVRRLPPRAEGAADATAAAVEALGGRAVAVGGDVAEPGTAERARSMPPRELGGLDAWVNNAGVSVLAPVVDTTAADMVRMLDVNVIGTFHGLQAAAALVPRRGRAGPDREHRLRAAACRPSAYLGGLRGHASSPSSA